MLSIWGPRYAEVNPATVGKAGCTTGHQPVAGPQTHIQIQTHQLTYEVDCGWTKPTDAQEEHANSTAGI